VQLILEQQVQMMTELVVHPLEVEREREWEQEPGLDLGSGLS
jgi:hypothetical protein